MNMKNESYKIIQDASNTMTRCKNVCGFVFVGKTIYFYPNSMVNQIMLILQPSLITSVFQTCS